MRRPTNTTLITYFLLLVVVAVAQRKTNRNVPVGADVKQGVDFNCPEEFGYYPHSTDCTQYYVCVFGGALLESCTGGLMYSHELQTCDWPRNVGCDAPAEVSNSAPSINERVPTASVAPQRHVPEQRISRPPTPAPHVATAVSVSSRGQPRQLHRNERLQDEYQLAKQNQQQLYQEADDALLSIDENESDSPQRVYRGQPSTVGQVQRDRDAIRHTNAIPAPARRAEKISVISFGTQRDQQQQLQQTQKSQPVQQYRVESSTLGPESYDNLNLNTYNSSEQYDTSQYDPYYGLYDDGVDLYRDIDYGHNYNTANKQPTPSQQTVYRGTPATSAPQVEIVTQRKSTQYIQPASNYNSRPHVESNAYNGASNGATHSTNSGASNVASHDHGDVYELPVGHDYVDIDDVPIQNTHPGRQPVRGQNRNELTFDAVQPSTVATSSTTITTPRPQTTTTTSTTTQRSANIDSANLTRPSPQQQSIFITLTGRPTQNNQSHNVPHSRSHPISDPNVRFPITERKSLVENPPEPRIISLTAGFTLQNRDNTHTGTQRPSRISFEAFSPPITNATVDRPTPFSAPAADGPIRGQTVLVRDQFVGRSPTPFPVSKRDPTETNPRRFVVTELPDAENKNILIRLRSGVGRGAEATQKTVRSKSIDDSTRRNPYLNAQDVDYPSDTNSLNSANHLKYTKTYIAATTYSPTKYTQAILQKAAASSNYWQTVDGTTPSITPNIIIHSTLGYANRNDDDSSIVIPSRNINARQSTTTSAPLSSTVENVPDEITVERIPEIIVPKPAFVTNQIQKKTPSNGTETSSVSSVRIRAKPFDQLVRAFNSNTLDKTTNTQADVDSNYLSPVDLSSTSISSSSAASQRNRMVKSKSVTVLGITSTKCFGNRRANPNILCNEIPQRTPTRGRGSAYHSTAGDTPATVNRGTPAASRSRPTLKPSTSIVSKATEFIDIYKYPPRRPETVYPTPQVDKTAAKCRKDVCLLPDCSCGGREIPGDLPVEQVPQIVLLTFDDSVNDLNKGLYSDLFEKGRVNPNGCPITATFYVSHEWTDYSQVQNLYVGGHEIASHTVSHSFGEQFSQKKWNREVAGQREILSAYGGVKLEDIRGMRAPFLSVGGNKMFKMLYDSNFTYDSSMPIYENKPPSWPYTLDYKIFHDCMIPPCPTRSYPGVWEVPMVMWQDLNGGRCSMGDACSNPSEADGVFKMLMKNFDRHYTSNRAPFGLFYHAAWFTQPHHKEGFIHFLDTINAMKDVYLITNWQAIQWVRDPTPLSRIANFQPFQCDYPNRPKRCNNPKVCNLWHKSGVRYMRTCQPCPDIYPWTGKTGIKSSRIDNDIDD